MALGASRRGVDFDLALTLVTFIGPHLLNSASGAVQIFVSGPKDNIILHFLIASVSSAAVWAGVLACRGGRTAAGQFRTGAALWWPAAVGHCGVVAYALTQYSPGSRVDFPASGATWFLSTPPCCFLSLLYLGWTVKTWVAAAGEDPSDGE